VPGMADDRQGPDLERVREEFRRRDEDAEPPEPGRSEDEDDDEAEGGESEDPTP